MELKLTLALLAVLGLLVVAGGCGEQAPPGKNISGQEYNKLAESTLSEQDREENRRMAAEAAIPGSNQGGR